MCRFLVVVQRGPFWFSQILPSIKLSLFHPNKVKGAFNFKFYLGNFNMNLNILLNKVISKIFTELNFT